MRNGFVKLPHKRPCSHVNNHGFISVYALMLLSVFLAFTVMLTQEVATFANVMKQKDAQDYIDLHILQTIKKEVQEDIPEDNEAKEGGHEESIEEKPLEDSVVQEQFRGCSITYVWASEEVAIEYTCKGENHHVRAQINREQKYIKDYAYE